MSRPVRSRTLASSPRRIGFPRVHPRLRITGSRLAPTAALAWLLLATLAHAGCRTRSFHTASSGAKAADPASAPTADGERAARKGYTFNVMAPLTLPSSEEEWDSLATRLREVKAMGAYAVSTDVWWGLVEGERDDLFRWEAYERLADAIVAAKLKWVPILSFHQCGGNVGDTCDFKLPAWLWTKYPGAAAVSEFGNESRESISPWSTARTSPEVVAFLESFKARFARFAPHVAEINVSFGPAGELRYPSYNAHDLGRTGYPTRGGLQAHSDEAKADFRRFVLGRYGTVAAAAKAWGTPLLSEGEIRPPASGEEFYTSGAPASTYGRDFFDWYHGSLLERGKILGESAVDVLLAPGSPFAGVELGAKVPGIHWRMGSDRAAELSAGLILPPASKSAEPDSRDYASIVGLFAKLDAKARGKGGSFVLHFTCLEMGDGEGPAEAASRAKSLVRLVGRAALAAGVAIKGENALSGTLPTQAAWDNMREAMFEGPYKGLTILRFDDVLGDTLARRNFAALVNDVASKPTAAP